MPKIDIFGALGEALNPHTNDQSQTQTDRVYADAEIELSDFDSVLRLYADLYKIEITDYNLYDIKVETEYKGGKFMTVYVSAEVNLDFDINKGITLSDAQNEAEKQLQESLSNIIDNLILKSL